MNFKIKISITIFLVSPLFLAGQDIAKFNIKQPVKINGGLTATNTFYSAQGMTARRDPYYWMLSGNVNFNLFGVLSVPISIQVSQQNRSYTQPFNQFGMSPHYKAWTAHAGYRSVQYSTYSVGGSQWLGGGLEYAPEKHPIYTSVLYGRFQKSVTEQVVDGMVTGTPAYERWGYAAKFGYQKKGRSLHLVLFRGKDNASTVPDSTAQKAGIKPGENLVWAINTRQALTKSINFDLEFAMSAYTLDTRIADGDLSANSYGGFFHTNTSTQVNKAIQTNVFFNRPLYQLKFSYRRIDPLYKTMGSIFLNNDIEDISAGLTWRMFKQKLTVSTTGGIQRNNLDDKLTQSLVRNAFSGSIAYAVSKKVNLNAQYSNFLSNTKFNNLNVTANQLSLQQNADSLLYNQVTQSASINMSLQFGDTIVRHGVFSTGSWQQGRDSRENNSDFYSGMAGYTLNFVKLQLSFNVGVLSTFNTTGGIFNQMLGPSLGINKSIKKVWRIGFTSSYTTNYSDHKNTGYNLSNRITAGVKRGKHHSLNADLNWLQRTTTILTQTQNKKSSELRGSLIYSYTF